MALTHLEINAYCVDMTNYVYSNSGDAVGFIQGKYVYGIDGEPLGHIRDTHVYRISGEYVGELFKQEIVDKGLDSVHDIAQTGTPGSIGSPGTPGNRGLSHCPYPDVFAKLK